MTQDRGPFTVAIDGPAAAGKGTVARAVAARFGLAHLDTGLLYRAVGAMAGDPVAAARRLTAADLARPGLRGEAAGEAASRVAAIPEVRAALLDFQRRFARQPGGAVLDGRDIGTVVCPEAEVKLYVTARPEVRAHRRWLEDGGDPAAVLAEVQARDARDAGRAAAPLARAADAVEIDTSAISVDEAVARAVALVAARRGAATAGRRRAAGDDRQSTGGGRRAAVDGRRCGSYPWPGPALARAGGGDQGDGWTSG
jgi:cytidylate kinase